eukprot:COSAG05_NODE_26_length_29797_cov_35.911139_13_plen_214_part_00
MFQVHHIERLTQEQRDRKKIQIEAIQSVEESKKQRQRKDRRDKYIAAMAGQQQGAPGEITTYSGAVAADAGQAAFAMAMADAAFAAANGVEPSPSPFAINLMDPRANEARTGGIAEEDSHASLLSHPSTLSSGGREAVTTPQTNIAGVLWARAMKSITGTEILVCTDPEEQATRQAEKRQRDALLHQFSTVVEVRQYASERFCLCSVTQSGVV